MKRWLPIVVSLLIVSNLVPGSAGAQTLGSRSCSGPHCTFHYGGAGDTYQDADCMTYREDLVTSFSGSPVTHTELLFTEKLTNCEKVDVVRSSPKRTFSRSESITHTLSGQLTQEVGLKTGENAKVGVELSHAQVASNGWQVVTTYSDTSEYQILNKTVSACSVYTEKYFGIYKTGSYSGSGSASWSVYARKNLFLGGFTYEQVTGECKKTTSSASNVEKKYITFNSTNSMLRAPSAVCPTCNL